MQKHVRTSTSSYMIKHTRDFQLAASKSKNVVHDSITLDVDFSVLQRLLLDKRSRTHEPL